MVSKKVRDLLTYKRYCRAVYNPSGLSVADINRMNVSQLRHASILLQKYRTAALKCAELRIKYAEDWIPVDERKASYEFPIQLSTEWADHYEDMLSYIYERLETLASLSVEPDSEDEDDVKLVKGKKKNGAKKKKRNRQRQSGASASSGTASSGDDDIDWAELRRETELAMEKETELLAEIMEEFSLRFFDVVEDTLKKDNWTFSERVQLYIKNGTFMDVLLALYLTDMMDGWERMTSKELRKSLRSHKILQGVQLKPAIKDTVHYIVNELIPLITEDGKTDPERLNVWKYALLAHPQRHAESYSRIMRFNEIPEDDPVFLGDARAEYKYLRSCQSPKTAPKAWLTMVRGKVTNELKHSFSNERFVPHDEWADVLLKIALLHRHGQFPWEMALDAPHMLRLLEQIDLGSIPDEDRRFLFGMINRSCLVPSKNPNADDDGWFINFPEDLASYCGWLLKQVRWI